MKKLLLYLQKTKKCYLLYASEESLIRQDAPEKYEDNGVVFNLNDIKEKWELQKVVKTNAKMTLEFKLILRKK